MADLNELLGAVMIASTVLVVVFVAGAVLLVLAVVRALTRGSRETRRLLASGTAARARILEIQHTGTTLTLNGVRHLQLLISVEVSPEGRPSYLARARTLVSELQIPQVQPGSEARVRFDPADPSKVAVEALGASAAASVGEEPLPASALPLAPASSRMPWVGKAGLAIGCLGALLGVAVAVFVTFVNMGLGPEPSPDSVCGRAAKCCEAVTRATGNAGSVANCRNVKKLGVPDAVCRPVLDAMRRSAAQLNVSCD